jgi:hypothetical protein
MRAFLCWTLLAGLCVLLSGPVTARAAEPSGPVQIEVGKETIDFKIGDFLATRYNFGPAVAKPYFFPVNAAPGLHVTRPWPMQDVKGEARDHVHQKSLWFCHGDVIPEGLTLTKKIRGVTGVDFWSEGAGHGKIVCVKVSPAQVEKQHGMVKTWNEWRTSDGVKILDEERVIHFYNLGGSWLLVFDIDLHANDYPITFGDTKEGSLGVRVRESLCAKGAAGGNKGQLTNAEGNNGEGARSNVEKKGVWGLKSAWCDYSGPVGEEVAGIAVLADPGNPVPSYWHSRGYGLMAANPFGRAKSGFPDTKDKTDLVKLAKGEHLKLRYGIQVHKGDVKGGKVAEAYEKFVGLKKEEK